MIKVGIIPVPSIVLLSHARLQMRLSEWWTLEMAPLLPSSLALSFSA